MILDVMDAAAIRPMEIDLSEKLAILNKGFESQVKPENGYFGVTEIDKGNGLTEVIGKNEQGHTYKEYLADGSVYKRRVNLGNHEVATTDFDDRGTAYMTTVRRLADNKCSITDVRLVPDTTIVKGNYSAVTDAFGRPVLNRIEDLQVRPTDSARQNLSNNLKDGTYQPGDHRGHIIADEFGGPATRENVIAQNQGVNQGQFRRVEATIESLKAEGHKVDYEVKTNYSGSEGRPSSFEPRITVDGVEYELPAELRKIYNGEFNGDSLSDAAHRVAADLGERYGLAHEQGLHSAEIAAVLTFSVSTYDNVSSFLGGEITAEEMVVDIVGDTATAGGLAYGTTFISTAVAQAMSGSSNALISSVGGSCAPALVVSFGVQSFEDISDFAQGNIDASELAYNLGENAAEVGGGFAGGALMGAAAGAVAGPPGAVVGGIVGGVVGCAVASEAYATAIELGSEGVEALGGQVESLANSTVELVTEHIPESVSDVRGAFNTFFSGNNLPFSV